MEFATCIKVHAEWDSAFLVKTLNGTLAGDLLWLRTEKDAMEVSSKLDEMAALKGWSGEKSLMASATLIVDVVWDITYLYTIYDGVAYTLGKKGLGSSYYDETLDCIPVDATGCPFL